MIKKLKKKNKKILGIIPARGGSKRIKRKNIKLLAGKPLIAYTIEAALKSRYLSKIVVTTEDERIIKIVKKYNVEIIKRPQRLATDTTSMSVVITHVIDYLEDYQNYSPDILVLLQPTSPLRTSVDIDKAIELFLRGRCDSVISVSELQSPSYWCFKKGKDYLKPLFGWKYFKKRKQDLPKSYLPNGAIFITELKLFRKNKSFYSEKILPYIMSLERSVDIDTPIDFKLVKLIIKNEKNKNRR